VGRVGIGQAKARPAFQISPSALALHVLGPMGTVLFWRQIIEELVGGPVLLTCSRLDVHADIVGLALMSRQREEFVCRSGVYTR
jgi:hypothetical protein